MRRLSIPVAALAALMAAGAADSASAQDAKDRASDVVCTVEKGGTILSLVPGGMAVKKGDLVCELDASGLNDRLIEETIAVKRAEGEYKTARLAHEAAMLAVKEYSESTYLLDKAATQCEIKLAESELAQASDHVDEVQRNFDKGTASKAQKVATELSFQRTKFALELAQTKLNHPGEIHQAEHGQAARRRGREDTRPGGRREGHPGAAAGPRAEDPPPDRGLPDRGPVGRPGVPCDAPRQAGRRDQRRAGRGGRPRPRAAGRRPRRARDALIG